MAYVDYTERSAFIDGLRGLADYLESTPEVPAPSYSAIHAFPSDAGWAEMCAEIDAIAAWLDVIAHGTDGGHYIATRSFGPVEYRAVAIPRKNDSSSEKG